ncbi:hypothetical protein FJU08_16050 [Martelella alba]|uniref:Flagellar motor switch protein FliN-like C-terminal domain-containing protein n=1 Tax=Martelella alba TaxID=2590451 RepID=A0A506U4S9_9HYPH|nr:FliM/FliN family flagellar motor switch protein [Martelella alba]TPW28840.1 hypothetical protein FJU08_16050 [Martelella alba]
MYDPAPLLAALPTMEPAAMLLVNRLAARQWQLPIQGSLEQPMPMTIAFMPWHRQVAGPFTKVTIDCSAGTLAFLVEAKFCDLISDITLPGWRTEKRDNLPTDWRLSLSFEHWLTELGLIETINTFDIASLDRTPSPTGAGPQIAFRLNIGDQVFFGSLDIAAFNQETLGFLDQIPPVAMLGSFTPDFACRITFPRVSLIDADYRRIRPGDLILLTPMREEAIPASLHIRGVGAAAALIHEDGMMTLNEAPRENTPMEDEDDYGTAEDEFALEDDLEMDEHDFADAQPNGRQAGNTLGELPIRIDVHLAGTRITLEELQTLGPGTTLPLAGQLTDPVTIRANGRAMASGYLVVVDGQLAVQIKTWPGKPVKGE